MILSALPLPRRLLVLAALCGVLLTVPRPVMGDPADGIADVGYEVVLRADPTDYPSAIPPPGGWGVSRQELAANATAEIVVTYANFPAQAEAAFEYAVSIWETRISSPVPILVKAEWRGMAEGTLAAAGPPSTRHSFVGAMPDTRYPIALANAITGTDLAPESIDISARFNSALQSWYFGVDGQPPPGTYDFATVVLHELGHGLGFNGGASVGFVTGGWGSGPRIFDRFLETGDGARLTEFMSGEALAIAFQSGDLWFGGPAAIAAGGGARPRLHAPNPWESGTSVYHLEDSEYAPGTDGSLMTSHVGSREVVHDPGPLVTAMLADLGWTVASSATALAFVVLPAETVYRGIAIEPPVVVEIRDAEGDAVDYDSTTLVTLSLTGPDGASIECPGGATAKAASGRATFSDCRVTGAGAHFRLVATSAPALTAAESSPFQVIQLERGPYRSIIPSIGSD